MFFPPRFFDFFPPLLLCFSFFLPLVGFLVAWLNQKFSARQSVASSTDGNWWPDIILCIMGSLFSAAGADLAHVSCCAESTCGSAGTQKEKKKNRRGNIRRAYNKCIFYVSLLLTKKEVGVIRGIHTMDEKNKNKWATLWNVPTGRKGVIHVWPFDYPGIWTLFMVGCHYPHPVNWAWT